MPEYAARDDVVAMLHDKTLVMVVGPTAMGKSTVMNEATKLDAEFARVSGVTTRAPRPNDEPGLYRYLSQAEADRLIAARELVQYAIFPTTGMLYGTEPRDFPGRFNLLDTLYNAVEPAMKLPFNRHVVVSLTAPAEAWQEWLSYRYPSRTDEYYKRLQEAKQSLEWSLAQSANHHWLVNQPDQLQETARQLIAVARGERTAQETPSEARNLLQTVNDLLSYG